MKLLFVLPEYPPSYGGGIGSFYGALLPALITQGHQVDVFLGSAFVHGRDGYTLDGINITVLTTERLERNLEAFEHYRMLPELRRYLAAAWALFEQAKDYGPYDVVEVVDWGMMFGNMGITSSNLWRREPVLSCGGWNEQLIGSQEVELMYRMVSAGSEAIFDEEPLTHVRVRQDSLSRAPEKRARYAANFVSLRGAMFEKMREETSMEKDREEDALNYVFRWIRELYKYDPEQAVDLHDQVIPQWFTPAGSGVMGNIFSIAYRTLGYSRAERLKRRLGRS